VALFVKTIRRSTDLANKIDWGMLNYEQHHGKIIDLTQLVINDLFDLLALSFEKGDPA